MEFYNKITFNENNNDEDSCYDGGSTVQNYNNEYPLKEHDTVTFDSTLKFIENM